MRGRLGFSASAAAPRDPAPDKRKIDGWMEILITTFALCSSANVSDQTRCIGIKLNRSSASLQSFI